MITKIEVDGFKSLVGFSLGLKPGLNILVGPNGSGKTNIVLFFEFLANMIKQRDIEDTVALMGGAGGIFQKIRRAYRKTINAKIYGSTKKREGGYLVYEYVFEVLILNNDSVALSKQELRIRRASSFLGPPDLGDQSDLVWDINISSEFKEEQKGQSYVIKSINPDVYAPLIYRAEGEDIGQMLREKLDKRGIRATNLIHDLYMSISRGDDDLRLILNDLMAGETFNIIPSRVKQAEDAAVAKRIQRDGAGLGAVLYAMKVSGKKKIKSSKRLTDTNLKEVIKYTQLANSTIHDIDAEIDDFNNQLKIVVKIKNGDYKAELPLTALSDGTIKWITLMAAIFTARDIFSIEEPENFLHPWMQAEILIILRDHFGLQDEETCVLMTTHSESLINRARPEELVLVSMRNGQTRADNVRNVNLLKEEIAKTGFGLGHFYYSGALE